MLLTYFNFHEALSTLEGSTLVGACNTVETSTYITSLLSCYYSINVTVLPFLNLNIADLILRAERAQHYLYLLNQPNDLYP